MNRQYSTQTSSSHPDRSLKVLRLLVAIGGLTLAVSAWTPTMAAETADTPSGADSSELRLHYVAPGDDPAYRLLPYGTSSSRTIASSSWSGNSEVVGPESDWFNLRPPGEDKTGTTLIPIREGGQFDGMMLNFEVKY